MSDEKKKFQGTIGGKRIEVTVRETTALILMMPIADQIDIVTDMLLQMEPDHVKEFMEKIPPKFKVLVETSMNQKLGNN